MPTAKKICRVCGAEYEACRTSIRGVNGPFRWQEVACSEKCGAEYLQAVLEARGQVAKPKRSSRVKAAEVATPVVDEVVAEEPAAETVVEAAVVAEEPAVCEDVVG